MVTCEDTLMWSLDPEAIECTSLPTLPPTTPLPMNCTAALSLPQNGTIISDPSVPAIPGTQVTFKCDNGLFPEGIMTATCLATGEWNKILGKIVCRNESIQSPILFTGEIFLSVWLSRQLLSQSLDSSLDS
ncbi:uncharacterized protein LOC135350026 [Halichondria panicea]|uniref:uncharacterized protein LOC135350026 n=1 Tax=Halichondria panicea TaxID=6063 RepID=UPI00312B5030